MITNNGNKITLLGMMGGVLLCIAWLAAMYGLTILLWAVMHG